MIRFDDIEAQETSGALPGVSNQYFKYEVKQMEGKVMKNITNIRCGKMTEEKTKVLGDTYSKTMTYASQCMYCEKLLNDGECPAYPLGIPMDLWTAKRKDCEFFEKLKEIKK